MRLDESTKLGETFRSLGRSALRRLLPVLPRGRTRLLHRLSPLLMPHGGIETRRFGGYNIRLDHRIRATKLMAYGVYEPGELRLFRKLLREGDVVFDLGSNVGYMAVRFAECVGTTGRVYAFEPAPSCLAALQETIDGSPCEVIQVVPAAVGRQTGTAKYYETEKIFSHGYGRINRRPSVRHEVTREIDVPIYRLDDYCLEHDIERPAFIKIDVEGVEGDVIEGMAGLFHSGIKPGLLTEVSLFETPPPELIELQQRLRAEGYRCYRLNGNRLVSCDPTTLPPGFHDNVFWFCTPPAGLV